MGSPRAELVLWELLLRCTASPSFHGNAQKQEQHGHTSTCQSCCLPGGSGPMSTGQSWGPVPNVQHLLEGWQYPSSEMAQAPLSLHTDRGDLGSAAAAMRI